MSATNEQCWCTAGCAPKGTLRVVEKKRAKSPLFLFGGPDRITGTYGRTSCISQ